MIFTKGIFSVSKFQWSSEQLLWLPLCYINSECKHRDCELWSSSSSRQVLPCQQWENIWESRLHMPSHWLRHRTFRRRKIYLFYSMELLPSIWSVPLFILLLWLLLSIRKLLVTSSKSFYSGVLAVKMRQWEVAGTWLYLMPDMASKVLK